MHGTDVREVPLTRGYVALIDAADWPLVQGYSWRAACGKRHRTFYAIAWSGSQKDRSKRTVAMHRLIMGHHPGMEIDHRDGNGLNNTRSNLRIATHSQNQQNKAAKRGTTSQYKGVGWNKNAGKWAAFIRKDRRNFHLGLFVDEAKAARRYDEAARVMFGEWAKLNFPNDVPATKQELLF